MTTPMMRDADPQEGLGVFQRVFVSDRLGIKGLSIRVIALIISCLLHLGLIVLLLMPTNHEPAALQVNRVALAQTQPNEERLTTIFFIPDDTHHLSDKLPMQTALQAPTALPNIELDVVLSEPQIQVEARSGEITSADIDRAARATSRIAYLSQIQARIERTWDHPLGLLDHSFHCQVKIHQTPQGEIKALTLSDCDGDEVWQQSLLRAVRNSAPFPAPRDEQSFIEELTLEFKTEPASLKALFTLLEALPDNATTLSPNKVRP